MESKLLAALTAEVSVSVTQLCEELGISRQSFYKYRRRFAEEGPPGLVARSRRPHRSPQLMDPALEDEIVRLRKTLPLHTGARAISFQLRRSGWPVPATSSIHRALERRGMVVAQPHKAPHTKGHRFEYPLPNGAWQIDATCWALTSKRQVWIMDIIDDHSRLLVTSLACHGPTGQAAWTALCDGIDRYGTPARVMSDNGRCFTARFGPQGGEADFERDLRALGIQHLLSTPSHPQTCGKIERQHQTLKDWLRPRRRARSLVELQRQLDDYRAFYNDHPHGSKNGATPNEAWNAQPPDTPGPPIELPANAAKRHVNPHGSIYWGSYQIGIGAHLAGHELLVIARDLDIAIFGATGLVRRLTIDPTRHYQPSGRPAGRPPKART